MLDITDQVAKESPMIGEEPEKLYDDPGVFQPKTHWYTFYLYHQISRGRTRLIITKPGTERGQGMLMNNELKV